LKPFFAITKNGDWINANHAIRIAKAGKALRVTLTDGSEHLVDAGTWQEVAVLQTSYDWNPSRNPYAAIEQ
jgi:hypothetical protein